MTEAMPFLQKFDITFLRPPTIGGLFFCMVRMIELLPFFDLFSRGGFGGYISPCKCGFTSDFYNRAHRSTMIGGLCIIPVRNQEFQDDSLFQMLSRIFWTAYGLAYLI